MSAKTSQTDGTSDYINSAFEYSKQQIDIRLVSIQQLDMLLLYGLAGCLSLLIAMVSWAGTLAPEQTANNWPLVIIIVGIGISVLMFAYSFSSKTFMKLDSHIDFTPGEQVLTQQDALDFKKEILENRKQNIEILENQIFWKNRIVMRASAIGILSAVVAGLIGIVPIL